MTETGVLVQNCRLLKQVLMIVSLFSTGITERVQVGIVEQTGTKREYK
jgi:hypothetical protein